MSATVRTQLRRTGIALAIAAAAVCLPSRAGAACGDYVHIADNPAADDRGKAASDLPDGSRGESPRRPCHGPGCSNGPAAPATPLTAPVTDTAGPKQLAARTTGDTDPAAGPRWHHPADLSGPPVRIPTSIFHPPPIGLIRFAPAPPQSRRNPVAGSPVPRAGGR
jgi:hypothetical protein